MSAHDQARRALNRELQGTLADSGRRKRTARTSARPSTLPPDRGLQLRELPGETWEDIFRPYHRFHPHMQTTTAVEKFFGIGETG